MMQQLLWQERSAMKLIAFETEAWEAEACRVLQPDFDLTCTKRTLDEASVVAYQDTEIATVFVHSRLPVPVLAQLPKLRLIATRSTGYDHIDLNYCAKAGIAVANVPDYGDVTVAEHVFALLLGLARHLPAYSDRARHADFAPSDLRGFDLFGKTLGVIGTGRIGQCVIKIARGFGMNILAYDIAPREEIAKSLGFHYVDLPSLLAEADVVSLHLPARSDTKNLFGEAQFALMKEGAVLINTARGNIVQIDALVRAITNGRIRAAGLDVLPQEPLIQDEAEVFRGRAVEADALKELLAYHVLVNAPNVLITPHVAYNTEDALHRLINATIENIRSFVAGQPRNLVGGVSGSMR
jgi:D-lactate dehydrogenase